MKYATLLEQTPGVVVLDNPEKNAYPMPIHAEGKDEVFVGRIRRDESVKNAVKPLDCSRQPQQRSCDQYDSNC